MNKKRIGVFICVLITIVIVYFCLLYLVQIVYTQSATNNKNIDLNKDKLTAVGTVENYAALISKQGSTNTSDTTKEETKKYNIKDFDNKTNEIAFSKSDSRYSYTVSAEYIIITDLQNDNLNVSLKTGDGDLIPDKVLIYNDKLIVSGTTTSSMDKSLNTINIYTISEGLKITKNKSLKFSGSLYNIQKKDNMLYIMFGKPATTPGSTDSGLNYFLDDAQVGIDYTKTYLMKDEIYKDFTIFLAFNLDKVKEQPKFTAFLGAVDSTYESNNSVYTTYTKYKDLNTAGSKEVYSTTSINKYELNGYNSVYMASSEIEGQLINNTSLHQENDNLLVTSVNHAGTIYSLNIMDKELNKLGEVSGICNNGKIYKTRYIGNRVYSITDSINSEVYIIDVSNLNLPKELGKIDKLNGVYDLFEYDNTRILAVSQIISQDSKASNGQNSGTITGTNLNIIDSKEMKVVNSLRIGDNNTYIQANENFDVYINGENKIVGVPVLVYEKGISFGTKNSMSEINTDTNSADKYYQGYSVFSVQDDNKLKLLNTISHYEEGTGKYSSLTSYNIYDMFNIGNKTYTVSRRKVQSYLTDTMKKQDEVYLIK